MSKTNTSDNHTSYKTSKYFWKNEFANHSLCSFSYKCSLIYLGTGFYNLGKK